MRRRLYPVLALALLGCSGPAADPSLSASVSRAVAGDLWRSLGNAALRRPPLDGVTFGARAVTAAVVTHLLR